MNIKLLCRIADIDNAIRISGDVNGMRLVLDFPDVDLETIVPQLITIRDQMLVLDLKTESVDYHKDDEDASHPNLENDSSPTRPEGSGGSASAGELDEQPIAKYRRSFV